MVANHSGDSGVRPKQVANVDFHRSKHDCDRKLSFIEDFDFGMVSLIFTLSIYFILSDRRSLLSQSRPKIYDAVIV